MQNRLGVLANLAEAGPGAIKCWQKRFMIILGFCIGNSCVGAQNFLMDLPWLQKQPMLRRKRLGQLAGEFQTYNGDR